MSVPNETQTRLIIWGRWASGGVGGYPTMSSFMRANSGGRASDVKETAPDILSVDRIVCRAEETYRRILMKRFIHRVKPKDEMERLCVARWRYYEMLDEACWYVHVEFNRTAVAPVPTLVQISG